MENACQLVGVLLAKTLSEAVVVFVQWQEVVVSFELAEGHLGIRAGLASYLVHLYPPLLHPLEMTVGYLSLERASLQWELFLSQFLVVEVKADEVV